ncbi:MAG: DUF721 domain-containing protein [Alphaproteobacteria bacterium]|nr:DUF721 domain-containing protein [Alphaproteobacteria bacterium]MBN2779536.1 DUF721 domain-containing protein [Alphaproteobacteria bacterium]
MTEEKKKFKPDPFAKRYERGPRTFSLGLSKIIKTVGGKYGFSEVDLIQNWQTIVGPEFADLTVPMKLSLPKSSGTGGILKIRLLSPSVATMLSHQLPAIREKINVFFGHNAVTKIVLVH